MNDQELWALLRELDDPRHLEWPRHFRFQATRAKFEKLVSRLDQVFECSTEVDRNVQDASFHGSVVIPAEATASGEHITITVSNFGDLAAPTLGNPASHTEAEAATLFDVRDRIRVDGVLEGLGYVVVSEYTLWARYDGPSLFTHAPEHPPRWWDRFFSYF